MNSMAVTVMTASTVKQGMIAFMEEYKMIC